MSEEIDRNREEKSFTRRKGVGLMAKAAVAGLGLGTIGNEMIKARQGIRTADGFFTPLYERHDIGIKAENIPPDVSVFFREGRFEGYMRADKELILGGIGGSSDSGEIKNTRIFPDDILNKLAQQGTEIMIGDITANLEEDLFLSTAELAAAVIGATAVVEANLLKKDWARRNLLNKVALGVCLWAAAPFIGGYANMIGQAQSEAIKRIEGRLYAMQADTHPELLGVFFRNLVMADKLLTVGKEIKAKTGNIPKIGFEVEGGHSGIEDLLLAGDNFCRALILAYPKAILQGIVDKNSGIRDFCSARLLKLSKTPTADGAGNKIEVVGDRRVIDEKLQIDLEQKLAV